MVVLSELMRLPGGADEEAAIVLYCCTEAVLSRPVPGWRGVVSGWRCTVAVSVRLTRMWS